MRIIVVIINIFVLSVALHATEFYLADSLGKQYGPFEFKQGNKISIATNEYTIAKVLTSEQKIIEKMKTIIIPNLDFRNANIADVVDFLQTISFELDKEPERMKRGLSIVFDDSDYKKSQQKEPVVSNSDPFAATFSEDSDPFAIPQQKTGHRSITLSMRNVSLYDAVNVVCKLCDMKWSIQNSAIMIEPIIATPEEAQKSNTNDVGNVQ
jgi:hypothetical protein